MSTSIPAWVNGELKPVDKLEVHLISPSEVALDIWMEKSELVAKTVEIIPHLKLHRQETDTPSNAPTSEKVRIAFVGNLEPHKGWPVFEELRQHASGETNIEFWVINSSQTCPEGYLHARAHTRSSDEFSTLNALKTADIDLVLHWAKWPETFSFSTFEAIAAGAFVITNTKSGNVAKAVHEMDAGTVLEQTADLFDLVNSGGLLDLAKRAKRLRQKQSYSVEFSNMSLQAPVKKAEAA